MNKNEPYWSRYLPSWKKPKPLYYDVKIVYPNLKHCAACTHTCEYYMYSEHDKSRLCPFYFLQ